MNSHRAPEVETLWESVMNAPSPFALTDAFGVFVRTNQALCSLLGREEAEFVGSHIGAVLDPADLAEDEALSRRLLAGEAESYRVDQRYRTVEGAVVPVRCDMWRARGRSAGAYGPVVVRLLHPLTADQRAAATQAAAVAASTVEAITAYSIDGTVIYWNPAAEDLYQLASERVVGRPARDVLPSEWASDVEEILRRVARGERIDDHERARRRGDGTSVEVSLTIAPVVDERGEITGAAVVARDITRRKRAESLLASQARVVEMIAAGAELGRVLDVLAELIEAHARSSRCSILLLDQDSPGRLRHGGGLELPGVGQVVEDIGHSAPGGPYGAAAMIVADLVTDRRSEACRDLALGLGLRTCWALPIVAPDTGAILGVFALYYAQTYRHDDDDWALMGRLSHLAALAIARHLTMHQLAHQAIHDPLTGLANRTLVRDRLAHSLERLKREDSTTAVLFLDLDRFKALNDSYGHDAGDQVLVELARRLQAAVRPTDTVARLGGDEFVVVCDGVVGEVEVVGIADRIARAVELPFVVEGGQVALTTSIGIALPRGDETPESLLEQADAAMYQAKERGKARFQLFDTAMHQRALSRLDTEHRLRDALDNGELNLVYQPLVELELEQMVGVEALLRWDHPDRGLLAHSEFLAVAEDTGLIVPIGSWVIEEACRQAAQWAGAGTGAGELMVHLNLAARQLSLQDLPERVAGALDRSGAASSTICLEITETVLMHDAPAALGVLQALKSLGVRLSIDDFGAGYSSLAYVNSFPIDELKIDRSFLTKLGRDEEAPIVQAVVGLAHALNLSVAAEGVETVEQVETLRQMGCDTAQGSYWSAPLPPEEVAHFQAGHRLPGKPVDNPVPRGIAE